MKKIIPVFFATDAKYLKYTAVSLRSLMDNARQDAIYRIHILSADIYFEQEKEIYDMTGGDERFEIRFVDVTERLEGIAERLPIRDYYNYTTYYRLFIADMFPGYDKAVYIDSDTVVLGDVADLYDINLGTCLVGAAHEQAMMQTDVYGEYVERSLGIGRREFFNAGVLLINCDEFRKEDTLGEFLDLVDTYSFVVTQDEDYLNILCARRVQWIDQAWNVEVFGDITVKKEDFKIIHYIMTSKPWHYKNCRFGEYFWRYAVKLPMYDALQNELESYTDEDRRRDKESMKKLLQTARYETEKENNYLNMVKGGVAKSKDRLEILDRIAQFEREGRFDEDVENDPPTKELLPEQIDYLRRKPSSRIKRKLAYSVARRFVNKLIADKKLIIKEIKGIENYSSLKSGAVITCNHFNAYDSFAMQLAYEASGQKKRRFYRVIREGNYTSFPGFYGMLMRNCDTFPLSSNKETLRKFSKSVDAVLRRGDFLLIYPEQSMWWNYRKPKPLKQGGFTFAVRNSVPVLPCFITMEDSDILGDDGFYVQEYTIHIGAPIYPDPGKSRKENIRMMMDANAAYWREVYESTYGVRLSYSESIG